jgi:hypothetical protein
MVFARIVFDHLSNDTSAQKLAQDNNDNRSYLMPVNKPLGQFRMVMPALDSIGRADRLQ